MICNVCKKDSKTFWSDYVPGFGRIGICLPCTQYTMPYEIKNFHLCNTCGEYFRFKFQTQNICGKCWYAQKKANPPIQIIKVAQQQEICL